MIGGRGQQAQFVDQPFEDLMVILTHLHTQVPPRPVEDTGSVRPKVQKSEIRVEDAGSLQSRVTGVPCS